jgi:DNA replication protein DnaC
VRLTREQRENERVHCGYQGCRSFRPLEDLYKHLIDVHQLEHEQAYRVFRARQQWEELAHFRAQAPERAKDWTLDTFPADDVAGRRALKAARTWITGEAATRPRLLIHGKHGSGKTGLACGIGRQWISYGNRVEFENVRGLIEAQKASFGRRQGKILDHLLIDWESDGLLVILDDVGAGRLTAWAVDTLALIIEHLHAADVPLIVTANYAPDELGRRIGHDDRIEGLRIVDRLCEGARVIPLNRRSLRVGKAGASERDQQTAPENEVAPLRRDDDESGESPRTHQGGARRRKGASP